MKILYIFQDEYPWDVRVEKIVNSLSRQHDVSILCRNRGNLEPEESIGDVDVYRIGGKGLSAAKGFPAFFSPWWIRAGLAAIRRLDVELIIVRDLPLCPMALILKKITRVPVIFDMAEDYPAMIQASWKYRGPKAIDYLVRNPALLRKLERFVLPRIDATWVVSDASRARILDSTNGDVTVIGNTPTIDILDHEPGAFQESDGLSVVYTGWVDEDRGLETVIHAVQLAREADIAVRFSVVGTGTMLDRLQMLARELEVEDRVSFLGWRSQGELRTIIAAHDVGIVPHHVTAHTETTLPNKVYDYMAMAKPVVVSNARALQELVRESNCGLVFEDENPESLVSCFRKLQFASVRKQMGGSGRDQIRERFNWSTEEKVLFSAVGKFETGYSDVH